MDTLRYTRSPAACDRMYSSTAFCIDRKPLYAYPNMCEEVGGRSKDDVVTCSSHHHHDHHSDKKTHT